MRKKLLTLWLVILALMLLSSCAFNLFSNFELRELLSTGTMEQKIKSAQSALSGGNYDAAIALAASIINQELGLNLKVEDLEKLLDSTPTIYQLAQALQDATPTENLIEAAKILVEAVAYKTNKDVVSLLEDISELLEDLGISIPNIIGLNLKSKSDSGNNFNFWDFFEESGSLVSWLARLGYFDDREWLDLLTKLCYFITKDPTQTDEDRKLIALFGGFYDICYMFNLTVDLNDDGKVTDEKFVKDVINNPDSIVQFSKEATSGLLNDSEDCNAFKIAYDILLHMLGIWNNEVLGFRIDLPTEISTPTLLNARTVHNVLEILFPKNGE